MQPLSYDAQNKAVKETLKSHGVVTGSWTHSGRKSGLQHGEQYGIPDPQLRQLGRWEHSRMNQHYSMNIARDGARIMAGQDPDSKAFYLSRESTTPPEGLLRLIFPRLEESWEQVRATPFGTKTRCTYASLEMFSFFRTVVIQDAPMLSTLYPDAPFWRHPPFNLPIFAEYKESALLAMEGDQHPMYVQLQKTMPMVAAEIRTLGRLMSDGFQVSKNQREIDTRKVENIEKSVDLLGVKLDRVISIAKSLGTTMKIGGEEILGALDWESEVEQEPIQTTVAAPAITSRNTVVQQSSTTSQNPLSIPSKVFNTSIAKVADVWEEWEEGLVIDANGVRSPSIKYMDEKFKAGWRTENGVRKRWERRRNIVQRIRTMADRYKMDPIAVIRRVDLWREKKKFSLDKLGKGMHKVKTANTKGDAWTDEEMMEEEDASLEMIY
jgi:hypothetical protein